MIKGTGIDIVDIDRIKSAIKRFGNRFLDRIYTPHEISYCKRSNKFRFPELSVRFAAKEAYAKAIGTGMRGIIWKDIEIRNDEKGKPFLYIKGKANKKLHVTLSHSQRYAVASVIMESK